MIFRLVFVLSILASCGVTRQSRFVSGTPQLGMDTAAVLRQFGKPYKVGVFPERADWYYKESLYAKKWYEVTTILRFTNGKLTSIEPGEERALFTDRERVRTGS